MLVPSSLEVSMPRLKVPVDVADFVALRDRERQVTKLDLWLPIEFLPELTRSAAADGKTVNQWLTGLVCDRLNLDGICRVASKLPALPEPPLPDNVKRIRPRDR